MFKKIFELSPCTHSMPSQPYHMIRVIARHGKLPSDAAVQSNKALREEFRLMVNGNPFGRYLSHYCTAENGCGCRDRAASVKRITKVIVAAMFRRRPGVPQLKETSL